MRFHPLITAAFALALVAAARPAAAGPDQPPDELVLYSTSDTDGTFARPRCRRSPILGGDDLPFAHQVGYYRRLEQRLQADETAFAPVALHLGDAIHPGPVGRYLLGRGRSGARRLADLLDELPWASITLGNRDLEVRRLARNAFADGALRADLPLRAANVACSADGGAAAVCEATGRLGDGRNYDVVDRGGLRILLVSILDPEVRRDVAPSRLAGLDVLEPAAYLERRLPEIRRETRPDLVFVQYHAAGETRLESLAELLRTVPGIDLMTTNKQIAPSAGGGAAASNGYAKVPGSGTYIVPVGRGPSHATVTRLGLRRTGGKGGGAWEIRRIRSRVVDPHEASAAPSTSERLHSIAGEFCADWGEPIAPDAPLAEPFDRPDFIDFTANVLRQATHAEVGLLNDGAIPRSTTFPLRDRLTYADVHTLLPYENPAVVVEMKGAQLRGVADALGTTARAVGLDRSGTDVTVNGRPLVDDRVYRVATNRFVAEGGDAILAADDLRSSDVFKPTWSAETPSVAEIVIHFVQSDAYARRGSVDEHLSPTENFAELEHRLLWELVGSVNASYNQVAVANPTVRGAPVYGQSQLQVQPTQQLHVDATLQGNADSQNHGWDNDLLVQYALARVSSGGASGRLEQTQDLVRAKSRYKYTGFWSRLGEPWWGPMPTAELQFETEFDRPEGRDWHKLEFTGIVGSSFELTNDLEIKLGLDLRRDFNDPNGVTVWGFAAAYQLDRVEVVDLFESPVEFESELEYFYNSPFTERIHELRTTNRLFFSVFDDLDITSTFSTFLYRSGRVGALGRNTELTFGVNYRWDEAIQTY